MIKKILATFVLALSFSYVLPATYAADKSTTSNAVTSFYGEYVEKPKDTNPPAKPTPPPTHNNGGNGNTGRPSTNNGTPNNDYTSGSGGTTYTNRKTPGDSKTKVIPHTGNTSQEIVQLSGISLLLTLMMTLTYIKQKGE